MDARKSCKLKRREWKSGSVWWHCKRRSSAKSHRIQGDIDRLSISSKGQWSNYRLSYLQAVLEGLCLKGSAKNSWSRAVAGVNGGLIDTNNRLNKVVTQTTEAILGTNTYDNQVKYLNTTKKPRKLSVDEWMQRIQNINLHLVNMEDGARIY